MSPSTKFRWRQAFTSLLLLAGATGAVWVVRDILRQDPARGLSNRNERPVTLTMTNSVFRSYGADGRLVAEATVDSIGVTKDRMRVELAGVKQGQFLRPGEAPVGFTAASAVYYPPVETLEGQGAMRVRGKGFDLTSETGKYDGRQGTMDIRTPVKGMFGPGRIEAKTIRFNTKTNVGVAEKLTYRGKLQDPDVGATRRDWTIQAERTDLRGRVYIHSRARATDGEVIVRADRIEQNTETQVITCIGNVRYWGPDANVQAGRVTIYRRERHAIFGNNVQMLVRPKNSPPAKEEPIPPLAPVVPDEIAKNRPAPSADPVAQDPVRDTGNLRQYPITIRAEQIETNYARGQRRAKATGNPQARQQISPTSWRLAFAPEADFDVEADWLILRSTGQGRQVRLINSVGDDVMAREIQLSTREGDDRMSAQDLTGTIAIDEEDLPPRSTGGGTGGGAGTGPSLRGPIGTRL